MGRQALFGVNFLAAGPLEDRLSAWRSTREPGCEEGPQELTEGVSGGAKPDGTTAGIGALEIDFMEESVGEVSRGFDGL